MRKRNWLIVLLVLLLMAVGAAAVQAQTTGAISGTIYQDTNADGICGEGDPTMSGVPILFTPDGGGGVITLISGSDGTYGLAAVTLGTWRVAARPPQGWMTTSLTPIVVVLSTAQPNSQNVNFCLAPGTSPTPTPTPTPVLTPTPVPPPSTLPESGATFPPALLAAVVLGAVLLLAGMGLIARDRRANR